VLGALARLWLDERSGNSWVRRRAKTRPGGIPPLQGRLRIFRQLLSLPEEPRLSFLPIGTPPVRFCLQQYLRHLHRTMKTDDLTDLWQQLDCYAGRVVGCSQGSSADAIRYPRGMEQSG